jgi:pimeloyl-ACP methyl ester carboxylesterase
VIPLLQQEGFNVTAAQIPLTSLADDIAVTRNLLATQKGPTVLVGHSYAGVVISGAANEAPNVEALVYIAAFGLDEGENIDALSKQDRRPLALPQSHRRTIRASFGLIEIVSPRHLLRMWIQSKPESWLLCKSH